MRDRKKRCRRKVKGKERNAVGKEESEKKGSRGNKERKEKKGEGKRRENVVERIRERRGTG